MRTCVVNVATGEHYEKRQRRLCGELLSLNQQFLVWNKLPIYSPSHEEVPYAFKAWALKAAADVHDFDMVLWCDASIKLGARPLGELWEYIADNGVWLSRNGWTNYEWTADSAYSDLFADELKRGVCPKMLREYNKQIPHVVATAFGLNLRHPKGRQFLNSYLALAQTNAFRGPWANPDQCCGPKGVLGHRHDQTAASVLAWRLGVPLTECPEWFAYEGGQTDRTVLIADGAY